MDGIFAQAIKDYSTPEMAQKYITVEKDSKTPNWLESKSGFQKLGLPVMIGGQAFDLGTTLAALQRPGLKEANPAMGPFARNPAAMSVVKMAPMIALAWYLNKIQSKHPKTALGTALAVGGLGAGIGVNNLLQMRK